MNSNTILSDVKNALGIVGNYQDNTINEYILEVVDYLVESGVSTDKIPHGLVARGVSDLWSYGTNEGKLSEYFMERATQLAYKR